MPDRPCVRISRDEAVGIITIDHPPVNVLDERTMRELDEAIDAQLQDPASKVIIITGAGTYAFIAGADVKAIAQIPSGPDAKALALKGQNVINKLEASPKPVIAAINSICLGGGNELAMACHMRIASDRARFGQPEINLGIIPGFGGTQRLVRICGLAKARELILTGDMINAQEALRIGLVNRVVPDSELMKQAIGLAKKITSKSRVAVTLAERAMTEGMTLPLPDALRLEAELFGRVAESEDMKEGTRAFIEKRQPKFHDR